MIVVFFLSLWFLGVEEMDGMLFQNHIHMSTPYTTPYTYFVMYLNTDLILHLRIRPVVKDQLEINFYYFFTCAHFLSFYGTYEHVHGYR